jgi:rhamnosyl/mannosyltransferase
MRVLHLGKFPARHFGGIETHVKSLTEGLAAAGVDVTNLVYDLGRTAGGATRTVEQGVRIVAVPCFGTLASLALAPGTFAMVRQLAWEEPFDIVHAHFPDPLGFASLPFAGRAGRVASWHSDIVRQETLGKVYGAAARWLFDPLDAVAGATPSHLDSTQMKAFRPRAHHVVPYGVDLGRFVATDAIAAKVASLRAAASDRPVVFALGRHVYYKGFEVLIDAMRDVDATLLLGGEGPLTDALRRRAERPGARGDVRFVGRIEDADLPAYYHACDLFCLPSLAPSEAFGIVQIEAMGAGKPIVNCRLDNAVNFVAPDGVCALAVEPGDAVALARALNRLLADAALRTTLGAAGRDRVARHFSIDAMVAATLNMYRQVVDDRHAKSTS